MTDRDFHETTHNGVRTVIYRANHPETGQSGFAGFCEADICVQLGWHSNRLRASWAALRQRRHM